MERGISLFKFHNSRIGAGKKIITTNQEIEKFPFYNANNIFVINRENIQLEKMFFQTPYKEIDRETYDKFSLEGFLYNIFVNPETDYWRKSM